MLERGEDGEREHDDGVLLVVEPKIFRVHELHGDREHLLLRRMRGEQRGALEQRVLPGTGLAADCILIPQNRPRAMKFQYQELKFQSSGN